MQNVEYIWLHFDVADNAAPQTTTPLVRGCPSETPPPQRPYGASILGPPSSKNLAPPLDIMND